MQKSWLGNALRLETAFVDAEVPRLRCCLCHVKKGHRVTLKILLCHDNSRLSISNLVYLNVAATHDSPVALDDTTETSRLCAQCFRDGRPGMYLPIMDNELPNAESN